ncbi:MAG: xanthine dehydrogenase family protein molybdopterin-binding subunit, partial [Alphaproteobacteria bacterium]|nr:xanthine dehydrogenase family protein molybdopterin-binding subunit [Alphaproteobacteria bacterium]
MRDGMGIGASLRRLEDDRLLRGRGTFLDDLRPADLLHAQVVRSPVPHARIRAVDVERARRMRGVRLVAVGGDLAADGVAPLPVNAPPPGPAAQDGRWRSCGQPALAVERVRYVGEPVAFVVAETLDAARDAAEAVQVDYGDLPSVTTAADAVGREPALWDAYPDNQCFVHSEGDAAATDAALAASAHVVTLSLSMQRVCNAALETRGAIGGPDIATGGLVLEVGTQRPHIFRDALADVVLRMPREKLRVIARDVGGGFGGKNGLYPEYVLVLWAARRLGRPVKWVASRAEALVADNHARDTDFEATLGLDRDHRFTALRVRRVVNLGAYVAPRGFVPTFNGLDALPGAYVVPAVSVEVRGVFTNTASTTVYRGAGRPECVHLCERLVDAAARRLGADPVALRRKNLPTARTYANALGARFEGLDIAGILDAALGAAKADAFARRRKAAARRGLLRGIGVALFVEHLHGAPVPAPAALALDRDGTLVLSSGTMANGQGHETAWRQIVATRLGIRPERMRFLQGDTGLIPEGLGTGGSWSLTLGGNSVWLAAGAAAKLGREIAAELLEAAVADVELAGGRFRVVGTDRSVGWPAVFKARPDFRADGVYRESGEGYPVACHVAEVEVDPATGRTAVVGYQVAQDCGVMVNPMLATGQLHGGIAQGLGQALLEHVVYDAGGQALTGSFMDYGMPR